MSKVWLVARHHFLQEALKRSFLIVLFSMPLFLVVAIGFGYLAEQLIDDTATLGYVDEAGFLVKTSFEDADDEVVLLAFDSRDAARSALESEQIDAYFVIPADYRETSDALLFITETLPNKAMHHFEKVVRLNVLSGQDPAIVERMLSGADVTVRATGSNREFPSGGPDAGQILPLIVALTFAFLVLTTAGYMMQVVVVEKENRTMEIIVSSISPARMMTGKILGIVGVAIIQIAVWSIFFLIAVWIGVHILNLAWLREIRVVWANLIPIILIALPTYLFIVALMTSIGSTLTESQDAEQLGPLMFLILLLPVYLFLPISSNPNGLLALLLSFFPGTAVVTMAIRNIFIEVPTWQILAALAIAILSAVGAIWLAGKAFRMSMLRYGQRLKLVEIFGHNKTI
jgi:ABC-2 type transport system permease protein